VTSFCGSGAATAPGSLRRLLLFAKVPAPGRVKTRLIGKGGLTPAGAASLHSALVADLSERLNAGPWDLVLMWALLGEGGPPPGLSLPDLRWRPQEGRDLGERLHRGLRWAVSGARFAAAVGSDHPDLELTRVEQAFRLLEDGRDVVLGPARDGGYYLIALRRTAVRRRLFEGIAWSTPDVLASTLSRVRELGLSVTLLPEAGDLDTVEDLARFRVELGQRPDLRALCPRTVGLLVALRFLEEPVARSA